MEIKIDNFISNIEDKNIVLNLEVNGYKYTYTSFANNLLELKLFILGLIEDQSTFYLTTQEKLNLKISNQTIFKFTEIYFNSKEFEILSKSEIIKKNKIIVPPQNFLITEFDYI